MRWFAIVLVASAALVATPSVHAEAVTFDLRAVTEDGKSFFEKDGEKNPTLTVKPGDTVTVNLEVVGYHNFRVDEPVDAKTEYTSDEPQTLTFTVPEDAPAILAYWCDPHRYGGMAGTFAVEGGQPVTQATPDLPTFAALAGVAGVALALGARRRAA